MLEGINDNPIENINAPKNPSTEFSRFFNYLV